MKALPVARFTLVYIIQEYSLVPRLKAGSSLGDEAAGVGTGVASPWFGIGYQRCIYVIAHFLWGYSETSKWWTSWDQLILSLVGRGLNYIKSIIWGKKSLSLIRRGFLYCILNRESRRFHCITTFCIIMYRLHTEVQVSTRFILPRAAGPRWCKKRRDRT